MRACRRVRRIAASTLIVSSTRPSLAEADGSPAPALSGAEAAVSTAEVHASWMDGHQFRRIRYACMIANFGSAHSLRKQPIILLLVVIVLVHVDNFDAVRGPCSIQPTRDSGLRREALPMLCDETDCVETGSLKATSDTVECGFKSRNRYADGTGETHVTGRWVGISFRDVGYGRHSTKAWPTPAAMR